MFPSLEDFEDSILFFETSEVKAPAWFIECGLRNYGITGVLKKVKGIIWGKPYYEEHYEAYKVAIKKVMKEFDREDLPILYNMNFGHTEPKICLPYGALAEIDCDNTSFSILESAVL